MDKLQVVQSISSLLYESNKLNGIGFRLGIYSKINALNILLHTYSIYRPDEFLKYTIIDDDVCIVKEFYPDIPEYFEVRRYTKLNINETDIDNYCIDIGLLFAHNDSYNMIMKYLNDISALK